jgi:putative zinc finger/helix-turn-helix YgiT family protein
MQTESLFEYACPECGRGTVRTTRVLKYKTKIKGYPFVVDEALIGVCDHCKAESFTPEETKRWEELFYNSLEARRAFLSPEEITELRTALGLSMEDFARLIGCTRQSISAWEKRGRTTVPSRMADILMRLVRRSLERGVVDAIAFLLDEAQKWGVVIEVRRPPNRLEKNEGIVLLMKKRPKRAVAQESSPLDLVAAASGEEEQIIAETMDGKRVGVLEYDFKKADLILRAEGPFPSWTLVDMKIITHDGQNIKKDQIKRKENSFVLMEKTPLHAEDVVQITLEPHHVQ